MFAIHPLAASHAFPGSRSLILCLVRRSEPHTRMSSTDCADFRRLGRCARVATPLDQRYRATSRAREQESDASVAIRESRIACSSRSHAHRSSTVERQSYCDSPLLAVGSYSLACLARLSRSTFLGEATPRLTRRCSEPRASLRLTFSVFAIQTSAAWFVFPGSRSLILCLVRC